MRAQQAVRRTSLQSQLQRPRTADTYLGAAGRPRVGSHESYGSAGSGKGSVGSGKG